MTDQRFWQQHIADAHLIDALTELKAAEAQYIDAGYPTVAEKVRAAIEAVQRARASGLGAHAHSSRRDVA